MRSSKKIATNEESSATSPDDKQFRDKNDITASSSSGKKAGIFFPHYGGIFSEAARRQKSADHDGTIESVTWRNKNLNSEF